MAFAAIAAIVQAATGVISSVNKSASDQFILKQSEYQNGISYARDRESFIYGMYQRQMFIIIALGLVAIVFTSFIIYNSRK